MMPNAEALPKTLPRSSPLVFSREDDAQWRRVLMVLNSVPNKCPKQTEIATVARTSILPDAVGRFYIPVKG